MDALLTDLYYNQHLTSINALYPEALQAAPPGLKITKTAVQNWLKNQGAQQQVKRQTHDDHPITTDNQGLWQLDLTFLDQMARVTVAQPQPAPVQGAVRNRGQRVAVAAPVTTEGLPENIPVTDDIDIDVRRSSRGRVPNRQMDNYQMGGRIYTSDKRYVNGGYNCIFTVIHVRTRVCYLYPMKDKTAQSCKQAAEWWWEDAVVGDHFTITEIQSDRGAEWATPFSAWIRQHNITHTTYLGGTNNIGIVNSLHSHLKRYFLKIMISRDSMKWIDLVEPFVEMYNKKKKHSSLKLKGPDNKWVYYTPWEFHQSQLLQNRLHKKKRTESAVVLADEHKWAVGDKFRAAYVNRGFIKKTTIPVWSKPIFTVLAVNKFQIQFDYPPDQQGPRWISHKYAQWVPNDGAVNDNGVASVNDIRFQSLIRDNRRQKAYDREMAQLA
jgi:transposase InsO family protein